MNNKKIKCKSGIQHVFVQLLLPLLLLVTKTKILHRPLASDLFAFSQFIWKTSALSFHFISFKMHDPFDNVLRRQTTPTNGRAKAGWCTAAHIGYKMVLMRKSTSLNTRPCSILFAHTVADVCVHLILMDLYFIGIQQENSIERNVFFSPLLLLNNNRKHKCGHV